MRYYHLLPDGSTEPMDDLSQWQPIEERRVARDTVGDAEVSTVFLAMDHSHGFGGVPILFESMVFGGEHDQWCERYSTLAEAREGHARILANLAAGREPSDQ